MMPTAHTASAATVSITKEQSGLVASDSLTSGTSAYWTFGGSAAQHNYYEDAQGLHLGVQSPSQGTWVNYYAGAPFVNAQVFHAVLTIPYTSMGGNDVFNPGLYVEGFGGLRLEENIVFTENGVELLSVFPTALSAP